MRTRITVFLLVGFLFLLLNQLFGQFGLRATYSSQKFPGWSEAAGELLGKQTSMFNYGAEAGFNYWFKLKKHRIEFLPEVSYFQSLGGTDFESAGLSMATIGMGTQIYALDLEGDCDCPTFSKQGPSLNKGLFFHFTPAAGRYWANVTQSATTGTAGTRVETNGWVYKAGLGLGLDIGLSDLITLSPTVSYYFVSKMTWDDLAQNGKIVSDQPKQTQFSLRFSFRPDYTRRRRY